MTDTIADGLKPWTPAIGQQVVVTSKKEWASDWVDAAGEPLVLFVAGVRAVAGGGVDVTVTDEWPIRARPCGSELTDGFIVGRDEQDDLVPYPALTPNASVPAELVERVSEIIYDYLDERFPDGALPGGVQLFADDHLDAEFKHEAGCDELAERILTTLPPAGRVEELEALVALADAAYKCAEAPHFIVQPFLSVFRKHGETIARARAALRAQAKDSK